MKYFLKIFFSSEIVLMVSTLIILKLHYLKHQPLYEAIALAAAFTSPLAIVLAVTFLAIYVQKGSQKAIGSKFEMRMILLCCLQIIVTLCFWFLGFKLLFLN